MICVDASVAAKWVLEEHDSSTAEAVYYAYLEGGFISPAFMPVEVTNAIWRHVARGLMTVPQAEEALERFLRFEVSLSTDPRVHRIALDFARRFQRPSVYDMHYVALAQLAGCDLWTADRNLLNSLAGRLENVKALDAFH